MTWKQDNAVRLIGYGRFKSLFLALTQTRKRAEFNVGSVHTEGFRLLLNPSSNLVPERRGAFQGVNGNPELLLLGKQAGRHVGAITHVFRDLENAHAGHGVHAGVVVQCPVYCARGYSEGVGYIKECYASGAHRFAWESIRGPRRMRTHTDCFAVFVANMNLVRCKRFLSPTLGPRIDNGQEISQERSRRGTFLFARACRK